MGEREARWMAMRAALHVFVAEHGHADVPRSFRDEDGRRLGSWLHRQRTLAATNALPAERRSALEAVGVRWSLHTREAGIAAFIAFQVAYGHGCVPHVFRTKDGFPLGTWVQSRRRQWAQDPHRALTLWPELAALGFVWEVRDTAAAWDAGLRALADYRRTYGDAHVPHWFVTPEGLPLGRWVDTRRVEFRRGLLSAERTQQLERLDMVWQLRMSADDPSRQRREDAHFARMLHRVSTWAADHGARSPAARTVDNDGVGIGRWLTRQRLLARQQRLAADRIAALDDWSPTWRTTSRVADPPRVRRHGLSSAD